MANNGTYGIKRPALITANDVDIFYYYRPSRSTDSTDFSTGFKKVDSTLLTSVNAEDENGNGLGVLPGMYNLKLPVDIFGTSGIYTVYIKPKEIYTSILKTGVLAALPNVRGIVLNTNAINTEDTTIFNNGGLVGYRVEYLDNDGNPLDMYRIITSNNRCEPVTQNFNNVTADGIKYRFNDSSNLIFCTVTPSSAASFKPSDNPSVGGDGQLIKLVNTKFNPIALEIEMTEHDVQDVVNMLEGDQTRNLDRALITTFNPEGEIYHQAEYGQVIDTADGTHTDFRFAKDRTSIVETEKDKKDRLKEQI